MRKAGELFAEEITFTSIELGCDTCSANTTVELAHASDPISTTADKFEFEERDTSPTFTVTDANFPVTATTRTETTVKLSGRREEHTIKGERWGPSIKAGSTCSQIGGICLYAEEIRETALELRTNPLVLETNVNKLDKQDEI